MKLNFLKIQSISIKEASEKIEKEEKKSKKEILTAEYFDKFKTITKYLTTLQKSSKMTRKKFKKFKKKVLNFKIQEEYLFR